MWQMFAHRISPARMSNTEDGPVIVFQDAHLIVVDKPCGIAVQADRTGDPCLLDQVKALFPTEDIGSPHRIDRPVGGLVIFTRNAEALRGMDALFREQAVEKTYLAIVEGATPPEGECRHDLERNAGQRKTRLAEQPGGGREAVLHFKTKTVGDRFSLLKVIPQGGAFHQIRAQLAAIGHPIKGDVKYGARRGEKDRGITLHAWKMRFPHPVTKKLLELEAPLPIRSIWPALLAL